MFPLIPLIGELGSAAIGAVAQAGATAMQNKNSRQLQEDAQAFEAAQAELAYDRQIEFYEKYQSPYAQIESAKKAGINPFSLGGSSSSGSVGSAPMASSSISSTPSVPNIGAFFSGLYEKIQEIKNQKAMADADVNLKNAEAEKIRTEIPWIDRLNQASLNMTDAQINDIIKGIELKDKEIAIGDSVIELNEAKTETEVATALVRSLDAEKLRKMLPYVEEYAQAQNEDLRASAAEKISREALNYANRDFLREQTERADVGTTLDVVDSVVGNTAQAITTGALIADFVGEIFGVQDVSSRWNETRTYTDKHGNVKSKVTTERSASGKKTSRKRRKR